VLGMEAYFTDGSRFDRPKRSEHEIYPPHAVAEFERRVPQPHPGGSAAYIDGYYYKPRTDWELFERHHEGLIATTGCLGGLVSQLILTAARGRHSTRAARFQDIFGRDHFFVEVQDTVSRGRAREQAAARHRALRSAPRLLATNDSHYTRPTRRSARRAALRTDRRADERRNRSARSHDF